MPLDTRNLHKDPNKFHEIFLVVDRAAAVDISLLQIISAHLLEQLYYQVPQLLLVFHQQPESVL